MWVYFVWCRRVCAIWAAAWGAWETAAAAPIVMQLLFSLRGRGYSCGSVLCDIGVFVRFGLLPEEPERLQLLLPLSCSSSSACVGMFSFVFFFFPNIFIPKVNWVCFIVPTLCGRSWSRGLCCTLFSLQLLFVYSFFPGLKRSNECDYRTSPVWKELKKRVWLPCQPCVEKKLNKWSVLRTPQGTEANTTASPSVSRQERLSGIHRVGQTTHTHTHTHTHIHTHTHMYMGVPASSQGSTR